eukprot:5181716-Pleurochrysis_carterae.AAC.2
MLTLLASLPQHQQLLLCAMALRGRREGAAARLESAVSRGDGGDGGGGGGGGSSGGGGGGRGRGRGGGGRGGRSSAVRACTLADLYNEYLALCSSQRLTPLRESEVRC